MKAHDDFAPTEWMGGAPGAPHKTRELDIQFTGSGSEYFRIWIVNLLLTLVTLTLYLPFARARRMAYFQNNTLVGGDPLGFHADPWKMFRGYLLVLVLGVGYWGVSNFMPAFAWVALLVLMVLWPALWRASLQFRLRNTSWRGVRLAFLGDLKSAYLSMLPFFLPGLAFLLFLPDLPEGDKVDPEVIKQILMVEAVVLLGFLLTLPWLMARIKRYQHGGYAFAQERTELTVGAGRFYLLFLKVLGVILLAVLLAGVLVGLAMGVFIALGAFTLGEVFRGGASQGIFAMIAMVFVIGLAYLILPLIVGPYTTSRLQNLLWEHTSSPKVQFQSELRFGPLFRVTLVNWLLIIVTLGLFWPFAKVRATRVRLEAMSLQVQGDVDHWVAAAQTPGQGVLGDAAGDFFGFDMGL